MTSYHLCPRCYRATPAAAQEWFCPNDGTKMLSSCPDCKAVIKSPYGRYCTRCGKAFTEPAPRLAPDE